MSHVRLAVGRATKGKFVVEVNYDPDLQLGLRSKSGFECLDGGHYRARVEDTAAIGSHH